MVPLCSALVKSHLGCWASQYTRNMAILERVQQGALKMVRGLECLICEERLRELGVLSLENRRLGGIYIHVHKYLKGGCKAD